MKIIYNFITHILHQTHAISHCRRSIFLMVIVLMSYSLWLPVLMRLPKETPMPIHVIMLFFPFFPASLFDIVLRLSWVNPYPDCSYPPPPTLLKRLLGREYGIYWFPVVLCFPFWLWYVSFMWYVVWYYYFRVL